MGKAFRVVLNRKSIVLICFGLSTILPCAFAGAYVIGAEDVLDITVWKEPDLTKNITVSDDGNITYPLVGKIKAAGLTTAQLSKLITEKLEVDYIREPQVTVLVKEYNSQKILVFGEVDKPGLYKLKGDTTVVELLSRMGGVAPQKFDRLIINRKKLIEKVTKKGKKKMVEEIESITVNLGNLLRKGDLSQNVAIRSGDIIYVRSAQKPTVYVVGQIKSAGPYEVRESTTVLELIKLAGGLTDFAASNKIKIVRETESGKQVIRVDLRRIMKGERKEDKIVEPGDIVIVPQSWL